MPCTAKKGEIEIPNINSAKDGVKDVDFVLTTRDMCQLIKADQIDVNMLEEEEFDSPLKKASGAGEIFGASGGVMEAALRSANYFITGKDLEKVEFSKVHGYNGAR